MPHAPTPEVLVECVKLRWNYSLATFCVIVRKFCLYVNKGQVAISSHGKGYYVFVLGWDTLQNQLNYGSCLDTYPVLSMMIDDCKIKAAQLTVHFILLCPCLDCFLEDFLVHTLIFFSNNNISCKIYTYGKHFWNKNILPVIVTICIILKIQLFNPPTCRKYTLN